MYFKTKYTYGYILHYGGIAMHQSDFADVQNRCGLSVNASMREAGMIFLRMRNNLLAASETITFVLHPHTPGPVWAGRAMPGNAGSDALRLA
ncbi:hypothetical protein TKWG_17385 [Advenella kashmirensis WT001]|uniref:Uncharacterized protein n=1 Tax=Advenella kashmirensis (strain DSM 17095 / LMG 22695 / WT001) TaxID=1036672 RepID=I3UEE4_ADVKW|nr:hypothetical protein TKWG_17385 [Advenella kashmirensis WT001]